MSKPQSEDSEGGIKEILQARGIEISCDLGRSVWFSLSLSPFSVGGNTCARGETFLQCGSPEVPLSPLPFGRDSDQRAQEVLHVRLQRRCGTSIQGSLWRG